MWVLCLRQYFTSICHSIFVYSKVFWGQNGVVLHTEFAVDVLCWQHHLIYVLGITVLAIFL